MTTHDLSATLADFARAIAAREDSAGTMEEATQAVIRHLDAVDGAGISLVTSSDVTCAAPTHDFVEKADALQHELRDGPCIEALRDERRIHVPDLTAESRWPQWTKPVADELGVRSVLALQLYVDDEGLGALNLYSMEVDAFDGACVDEAEYFAAHAAAALASARRTDQFREAMTTRTSIGQAQGILMARYGLDPDQAFRVLKRVSQDRNVKINQLALRIVGGADLDDL